MRQGVSTNETHCQRRQRDGGRERIKSHRCGDDNEPPTYEPQVNSWGRRGASGWCRLSLGGGAGPATGGLRGGSLDHDEEEEVASVPAAEPADVAALPGPLHCDLPEEDEAEVVVLLDGRALTPCLPRKISRGVAFLMVVGGGNLVNA